MENKWVDIEGYEGFYQVNRLGQILSLDRIIMSKNQHGTFERLVKGKIMTNSQDSRGYLQVTLTRDNIACPTLVHRLVASAFIPNDLGKPTVNHEDGDKHNNSVENLTWATRREQQIHAYANGLISKKGNKNGRATLTEGQVMDIVKLKEKGFRNKDICTKVGASKYQVSNILLGVTWGSLTGIKNIR